MKNYFDCAARCAVCILAVAPDATGIVTEPYVTVLEKTGAIMRQTLGSQACTVEQRQTQSAQPRAGSACKYPPLRPLSRIFQSRPNDK